MFKLSEKYGREILTVEEVAEGLGVEVEDVIDEICQGKLKADQFGKKFFIHSDAVDERFKININALDKKRNNINKEDLDNKEERGKVVFSVDEIQGMLGIGRNKAYKLVNSGIFPVRRIDNRIVIPKETFLDWLNKGE